jgi:hypothetical protein
MKSIVCAVAVLVLSVGAAQAFTYDGHSNFNSDGTMKYTDSEDQLTDGSAGSNPSKSKSGFSVKFGSSSTDSTGFGVQNRFLPTGNRAFASPFSTQGNFGPQSNFPN